MSHFAALSVLTAASLNTLEARIAALEAADPVLAARVTTLEAADPVLAARITALEAADPVLAARVTALEAADPVLAARVTVLEAANVPLQAAQHGETSTQVSESAGTLTDTGLTVSITTTVVNSKILIDLNQMFAFPDGDPMDVVLKRDSTTLETLVDSAAAVNSQQLLTVAAHAVDVPGAIGTYVYKTQFRRVSGSGTAAKAQPSSDHRSSIRVTEVRP